MADALVFEATRAPMTAAGRYAPLLGALPTMRPRSPRVVALYLGDARLRVPPVVLNAVLNRRESVP